MTSGYAAGARDSVQSLLNLTTAACQCFARATGGTSKLALSGYILRNLASRFGFHPDLAEELTLDFEDLRLCIRPLQGELYLYKEIFLDNVYSRHPHFQLQQGWSVFDVGANIGVFALKAGREVEEGRVYAFEPNPQTYPRLLRNLELNNTRNVSPLPVALGDCNGTAGFDPAAASTVGRLVDANGEPRLGQIEVPMVTLADLLRRERVAVVNLLKMDVEGAEVQVLRGAGQSLAKVERLVMEYHSSQLLRDCLALLEPFGFRLIAQYAPSCAYFSRIPE